MQRQSEVDKNTGTFRESASGDSTPAPEPFLLYKSRNTLTIVVESEQIFQGYVSALHMKSTMRCVSKYRTLYKTSGEIYPLSLYPMSVKSQQNSG